MKSERVSSGNEALDRLLGGGIEKKTLTQFVGEPAAGKTTLCLIAAAACLRAGHTVVWIDTEGFSVERFRQVAGNGAEKLAERLVLYEPVDFVQQGSMILDADRVLKANNTGLVVMDSATALYRTELDRGRDAMQALTRQMLMLLGYAKRYDIPVLITNQVYVDTATNRYLGLGGTALGHISKAIVSLEKRGGMGERRAHLVKHRSLPSRTSFDFEMAESGIRIIT
ncbi:MAG: DNA repair and recombination protein RadB [Methanoregula sp.]|nr:MAG: DNA repair and recombination protein RadB [Methanoregula sp.]